MTNQEILKKAIEKAVKSGYTCGSDMHYGQKDCVTFLTEDYERPDEYKIIFSHDFAKAFWGEDCVLCPTRAHSTHEPAWQYHLQQMVLEENPIQYLEKFLD